MKTSCFPSGEIRRQCVERRALGEAADVGAVGRHRVDLEIARLGPVGVEDDPPAVGRPVRVLVQVRRVGQLLLAAAVAVHHPDLPRTPRLDRVRDPVRRRRPRRIALVGRLGREPAATGSVRGDRVDVDGPVPVALEGEPRAVAREGRVEIVPARERDLSLAAAVRPDHEDVSVAPAVRAVRDLRTVARERRPDRVVGRVRPRDADDTAAVRVHEHEGATLVVEDDAAVQAGKRGPARLRCGRGGGPEECDQERGHDGAFDLSEVHASSFDRCRAHSARGL